MSNRRIKDFARRAFEMILPKINERVPVDDPIRFTTRSGTEASLISLELGHNHHHVFKLNGVDDDGLRATQEVFVKLAGLNCDCEINDAKSYYPDVMLANADVSGFINMTVGELSGIAKDDSEHDLKRIKIYI